MFSSNLTKFFVLFALFFSLFPACRWWPPKSTETSGQTPVISDEFKSGIPFSTNEPEQFQAEIVITAGDIARRTFVARNGPQRRFDFNFGQKNQVTNLQTDKVYLILPDRKIYAESSAAENVVPAGDWSNFLTTEWLSEKHQADFEKLETADNITKYRIRLADSEFSEIIVSVNETLSLLVKQEFYSLAGEQKTLTMAVELKNFKLQTDENLFSLPKDSKKVSLADLRKELKNNE